MSESSFLLDDARANTLLIGTATEIEGIFRLSGSSKRIKDLQMIFNSPDRYGKGLDWTGFTVHDAANILRRYLNQLPEPIIPLHSYERFRDPLRHYVPPPAREGEAHEQEGENAVEAEIIKVYQQAITELPPLNRQLLLYILDLLAVFASKSDINRMTSANLAAIFQPGMLSHPSHDMKPDEYRLSQDVLVFLIENQDHFLIGMRGTAADEETVRDVQSGATTAAPASATTVPTMSKNNMARSSSNASAGAESVRRYGGLRRNVSVSSSKQSKRSSHAASPVSPGQMSAVGVHRSSTLPSKKSPGLSSNRFPTRSYSPTRTSAGPLPTSATTTPSSRGPSSPGLAVNVSPRPDGGRTGDLAARDGGGSSGGADLGAVQGDRAPVAPVTGLASDGDSRESLLLEVLTPSPTPMAAVRSSSPSVTPAKERNFSSLFSRSPTSDSERRESRPGKKLRKKRIPGAINGSPHSSTHSLEEK